MGQQHRVQPQPLAQLVQPGDPLAIQGRQRLIHLAVELLLNPPPQFPAGFGLGFRQQLLAARKGNFPHQIPQQRHPVQFGFQVVQFAPRLQIQLGGPTAQPFGAQLHQSPRGESGHGAFVGGNKPLAGPSPRTNQPPGGDYQSGSRPRQRAHVHPRGRPASPPHRNTQDGIVHLLPAGRGLGHQLSQQAVMHGHAEVRVVPVVDQLAVVRAQYAFGAVFGQLQKLHQRALGNRLLGLLELFHHLRQLRHAEPGQGTSAQLPLHPLELFPLGQAVVARISPQRGYPLQERAHKLLPFAVVRLGSERFGSGKFRQQQEPLPCVVGPGFP